MRRAFLENASVSLKKGVLQSKQDALFLAGLQVGKSLERVQQELLDCSYSQVAGDFPCLISADTIGNQKDVPPMTTEGRFVIRKIGVMHLKRSRQLCDDESVLV